MSYQSAKTTEDILSGEVDAAIDAVLTDDDAIANMFLAAERAGLDENSEFLQTLGREERSRVLREARKSGHETSMSMATGLSETTVDMSGGKQIQAIQDLFRKTPRVRKDFTNTVFQCVLFSGCVPPTGRGKSSTAYWLTEQARFVDPETRVMTNNPSDEYETVPEQWTELKQEIRKTEGWSLIMLDEAAQFLQYADQGAGKAVSQLMKLLRHNQCHLILVGHTGMDVPADIRRQMFFIDKTAKTRATLGYGLVPKTGDNRMTVADEVMQLTGIPHTAIKYKSQGEEAIQIKFDDEDDDEDDNEWHQCQATTRDGHQCPNKAKHGHGDGPPVVCANHRGLLDDIVNDEEKNDMEHDNTTNDGDEGR